jgi:hypothetical protein
LRTIRPTQLNVGGEQFEQVNSFKYLGTTVNTDNCVEEEIKEITAAGNRTYHAHKILFISKLVSRNVILQLYNALIRPTVTYASERWVLKEHVINKLMTLERNIMKKIYSATRTDDGYWRIKTNQQINGILKGQNMIGFIKKTKTELAVTHRNMTEDNIAQM